MGEKRNNDDIWSINISLNDFINILEEEQFTHVYIYSSDDIFNHTYKELFESEIRDKTLYEIKKEKNSLVLSEVLI